MPYPFVSEDSAKAWFRKWQETCEEVGARIAPNEEPKVEYKPQGDEFDWEPEIEAIVGDLMKLLEDEGEKTFEAHGAVLLHKTLPDHEALRDPEFWYWFATVPGRALIEKRYPFKDDSKNSEDSDTSTEGKRPKYLPGRNNFVGSNAKEVLFFRLWIRAEMSKTSNDCTEFEDAYEFTQGGTEFWRSHLLRVLYAQHRPFLQAFVDFQFPGPVRDKPKLKVHEVRQLAKDLAKACANVSVELLDREQSKAFIERVWAKTSAAKAWVKD